MEGFFVKVMLKLNFVLCNYILLIKNRNIMKLKDKIIAIAGVYLILTVAVLFFTLVLTLTNYLCTFI